MATPQALTVKEYEWNDEVAQKAAEEAARAAVEGGAQIILDYADNLVPYLTGALDQTGHIEGEGFEARVVYGTDYGPILRAHPEWDFHGRSGRWLDEAVAQTASIRAEMEKAAQEAWPNDVGPS